MTKIVLLKQSAGEFAENKDIAKQLRVKILMPELSKGREVIMDFDGVKGATQSFVHALISDPIREYKDIAFDKLIYKNCNDDVKEIIAIVYRYMQESMYGVNNDV